MVPQKKKLIVEGLLLVVTLIAIMAVLVNQEEPAPPVGGSSTVTIEDISTDFDISSLEMIMQRKLDRPSLTPLPSGKSNPFIY